MVTWLNRVVGALVIVGIVGVSACATAATPTPTAAPAKPTSTAPPAAKPEAATPVPKATAPAAAKPAEASAAKPAAGVAWKAEWDKTVEAAKKEGKVVVAGSPGQPYREAVTVFQKAYPDIKVEVTGILPNDFAPKVIGERNGGQYLWDVHTGGGTTMNSRLKPNKVLAPLKPALILPEVLDNSKWLGGFDNGWIDKEGQYVFGFAAWLNDLFKVNRDVVPESELNKVDQILDPKWKGKIVSQQVFSPGPSGTSVGWLLLTKGEDWLRRFFSQGLVITTDGRSQMEWLVRGRNPIAFGGNQSDLLQFNKQGLGKNVKMLDPDDEAAVRLTGGTGYAVLIDRAPHPNAAKVFINWLLSKEGQKAYTDSTKYNSRRLDVQGPAGTAPKPSVKYRRLESEELYPNVVRANQIAKELIK